jgi:hypothetical protein
MLSPTPPRSKTWGEIVAPIEEGENGWRAYALQVDLNALGFSLELDGAFGATTKKALTAFQEATGLVADGVAGPATQAKVLSLLGSLVHEDLSGVPDGLMRGFAEGEGANVLAATNWSVSAVDRGPWHMLEPDAPGHLGRRRHEVPRRRARQDTPGVVRVLRHGRQARQSVHPEVRQELGLSGADRRHMAHVARRSQRRSVRRPGPDRRRGHADRLVV